MYLLKTEHDFDSAHFLSGYDGKCKNIHGHRWKVEVEVESETLHEKGQLRGMVVDFSDFKKDLRKLVDDMDHTLIIQKDTMRKKTLDLLKEDGFYIIEVDFRPTAENFAHYFYEKMKCLGYSVRRATVYETPINCATYEER